jgi:hypothetical protein
MHGNSAGLNKEPPKELLNRKECIARSGHQTKSAGDERNGNRGILPEQRKHRDPQMALMTPMNRVKTLDKVTASVISSEFMQRAQRESNPEYRSS